MQQKSKYDYSAQRFLRITKLQSPIMRTALLIVLLAVCLTVSYARYKSSDFTDAERMEAAVQGVKEAKQHRVELETKIAANAKLQSKKHDTSAEYLARFFRAASQKSVKMGKARLTLEDAVKRAERILLEKKRAQMATAASLEDQAEVLAEEIFHKPGSLLTKEDFAHIYKEIPECLDAREEVNCQNIPFFQSIRTPDGTCNNLEKPTQGSSFTGFQRLAPAHYEDGLMQLHGFRQSKLTDNMFRDGPFTPPYPSARLISSTVVRDRTDNDSKLTHLVMQWGQFLDHDLDLVVEISPEEAQCNIVNCTCTDVCAPIRVPRSDEVFGEDEPRAGACLPFVRSVPVCETGDFQARNPINELTHYIDGSMIYGSTGERSDFLRTFQGGRLKDGDVFPPITGKPSLPEVSAFPPCIPPREETLPSLERCCPEGRNSCFIAGDVRVNEQVSLTVMHTIWVREHNRIAAELAKINPQWDDERIYQESRNIVIAQIQQITFTEFLPALFGNTFFKTLIGPYPGYQPNRDASVPNSFATAAFRFGHSLIQDAFVRAGPDYLPNDQGPLPLRDAFMNPQAYFDSRGTDPILRGWITQPARATDEFLNSVLTTQLFEREEGLGMDLASLNIQRGRDHGLPPYPAWKKFCQNRFKSDLPEELFTFSNDLTKIRFLQTYGALDTVDLWVGGLAEEPIPGGVIGPTFACIFAITFSDLRNGDRFWYENDIFTPEQLAQIKQTSLARVLCDNGDAITTVQPNAFFLENRRGCVSFTKPGSIPPGVAPGIDFAPWNEDPFCYQRVRLEPHEQSVTLFFVSILPPDDPRYYPVVRLGPSTSPFEECIPFQCPTALTNTQVIHFPADFPTDDNFRNCQFTANSGLPPSVSGVPSVYQAIWSPTTVQPSIGLHKDLTSCLSSTVITITFTCPPPIQSASTMKSNAELENELVHILQAEIGNTGGNFSLTYLPPIINGTGNKLGIPESILGSLTLSPNTLSPAVQQKEAGYTGKASTTTGQKANVEGNTDQLVHLLEETLNELKGH